VTAVSTGLKLQAQVGFVPGNVVAVSSTAAFANWPQWYSTIVVNNLSGQVVWLTTDGSTVTVAEAGADVVPVGATLAFANRTPLPDIALGEPGQTQVSLIVATGSGNVVVTVQ
jgi:hypothetical protein